MAAVPREGTYAVGSLLSGALSWLVVVTVVVRRLGSRDDRQQCLRGRNTRHRKGEVPSAWDAGDDLLEKYWVEMKRQATIPDPMLMTAFEASSRVAEHEGTRREGRPAVRSAVLEGAACDGGDACQIVLLFERTVVGTGRADDVLDPPAWPRRQQMHAQ
jgi:hypothetical protein